MQLKNFQYTAINKLVTRTKDLFYQKGQKKIIFKSPTGSGKTIMVAEFLNRIIQEKIFNKDVVFIWTTPRKTLTLQSKSKLEAYLKHKNNLKCVLFEDLIENIIPKNNILFLNWESINKKNKNTIIVENEREFYLSKVIERTISKNREIILIIDESHHHATSEISQKLIKDISPKISLEVSATPVLNNPDEIVSVSLEDVKVAGLIKKTVILNHNFENLLKANTIKTSLANGTEKFVIDQAIKKQTELFNGFKKIKSKVRPLILIQLPDNLKGQQEDRVRIEIQEYLEHKYKIKTENGKLAIRLSEDKKNLENISKIDNEVEVLIFKQAIALGWDCPRAQILVLFRNWKSLTFSIQTVGRIMRMPEIKKGHYKIDKLNNSYVFTNLNNVELREDYGRDYLTIYSSFRKKNISLNSYSRVRQREKTRLSPLFISIFLREAKNFNLEKKIKVNNKKANFSLINDYIVGSTDELINKNIKGKRYEIINLRDKQLLFDYFVRNNLSPFFPEDRSVGRVKEAIYQFFRNFLNLDFENSFDKIVNIVLSDGNIKLFSDLIDISKEKYSNETEAREDEIAKNTNWNFPESLTFAGDYFKLKTKKSVMQPFYYDYKWKTEEKFIELIDKSKKIHFWFKNGDRDQTFFSIPYKLKKQINLFYVDFIVKFKSGKIGLYDTKSGITIDQSKEKNDGLQKYISSHKNLIGGIVTNNDPNNFKGRWLFYNGEGKSLNSKNLKNWKYLDI